MRDGQSINDHCLTMIKDLEELEKLGLMMQKKFQVDLILQFLTSSYGQFIVNYHMNNHDSTLSDLVKILVTKKPEKVQRYIPREPKEKDTSWEGISKLLKIDLMVFSSPS